MRISFPSRAPVDRATVTAVVPCYKYGRYLPDCVHSVLAQTEVDTRVLIIDDASPDDSWDVAQQLAASDDRVTAIRNQENLGAIGTFNEGIFRVESEYLVLISADDLLAPGALGRSVRLMQRHPAVGMVYGHARAFTEQVPQWRSRPVTWSLYAGGEWLRRQFRRGWNPISSPEVVVRTSVQRAAGPYNAEIPHTADLEMWLRIAAIADIGHINGVDQAFYRVHDTNMSAGYLGGVAADLRERFEAYSSFLRRTRGLVDAGALQNVLRTRAADEVVARAIDAVAAGGPADESLAVAELAREMDPAVVHRAQWGDLHDTGASRQRTRGTGQALRRAVRRLTDRARWWRWRIVGL